LLAGAAAAVLLLTLAGYAGRWHPVPETLANFRLHLALAAALILGLAGFAGSRRSAGLALAAGLAAAIGLGPVFDAAERPGSGRPVTLLYANLRHENREPGALVEALRKVDADVLVTSETTRGVAVALAADYPHRLVSGKDGPALRTAIWSRYPLSDTTLYLNNTVAPTAAAATISLGDGAAIGLIGAHFSRPFERLTHIQVAALEGIAADVASPVVVMGDFNAAPWAWSVARAAEVTGTRVLGGYRVTWQGSYQTPLGAVPEPWGHQIDQVLLSEEIGVEAVEMLALPGSDHRGVLLRLRVPPG
jgi:endonuclease/exonuclease/phosphatase (EEP) superfamily protein YafD